MIGEKNSSNGIIFIHADLDLYGLDPYEFRIYAHIARRGNCYSNLKTMAEICKMSVRKAQKVLQSLQAKQLIEKEMRKGRTDVYRLAPREKWQPPEPLEQLDEERQKVLEGSKKQKGIDKNIAF